MFTYPVPHCSTLVMLSWRRLLSHEMSSCLFAEGRSARDRLPQLPVCDVRQEAGLSSNGQPTEIHPSLQISNRRNGLWTNRNAVV